MFNPFMGGVFTVPHFTDIGHFLVNSEIHGRNIKDPCRATSARGTPQVPTSSLSWVIKQLLQLISSNPFTFFHLA